MGSIPAGAGEPRLSPECPVVAVGSIPAGAGEPLMGRWIPYSEVGAVYPRGCGGTTPCT